MAGCLSNSLNWSAGIASAALAGCSIHPIPDDVSRYDTAAIVKNIRCEAKDAVRERIRQALHERGIYDVVPDNVLKDPKEFAKVRRRDPKLAATFRAFGVSTITYTFMFDITEENKTSGSVNFLLPITGRGSFNLLAEGQFDKKREGKRDFTTVESFEDLAKLRCGDWVQPGRNPVYPITGSIGVEEIVTTFINVSVMGTLDPSKLPADAKSFTDTIKFTTEISGAVNPTLKLDPIPDRLRVTEAGVNRGDTRKDIHQVTISLLFPDLHALREAASRGAMLDQTKQNEARALEDNCVAIERAREERFRTLRRTPPAIYCRKESGEPPPDRDR